jgi:tryptophan-rich sensory protein
MEEVMKYMGKNDILKLILCIIICQALGSSGSVFTNMSVKTWYPTLVKPWFAPPDGLIPVVWIILFTLMGISLFLVWREGLDRPEVKAAIYIFALQFVFNIAWSGAFFGMRSPYYGLIVIVLLWLMILLTIFKFWQVSKNAALLLVPYILWVSFAMALNYNIMVLNP